MLRELSSVPLTSTSIDPFREILEPAEWDGFRATMQQASTRLNGRRIWNINSTAHGGGVAEMLAWQIPYERGVGMDVRWLVIEGQPAFFAFTKRLHSLLHGVAADGSAITDAERTAYEGTLAQNAEALAGQVRAGDVVIVHDPQPAGLIPNLVRRRCCVIWRCHIGIDEANDVAKAAWHFLMPYVGAAHATVFSRRAYVWDGLEGKRVAIIPPAIDAFTPKNEELAPANVAAILKATGILADGAISGEPSFRRRDGSPALVRRSTELLPRARVHDGPRVVVQVSRWDRLKDPLGVLQGFADFVAPGTDAHLILAGPGLSSVVDDPEEKDVFRDLENRWNGLQPGLRDRIHLARLPTKDTDENAAVVNALQRRADVVVQKSLREGFGLTVAEAMWKGRPVVATRVGGIQDQIQDGKSGVLIDDPRDLASFGRAVNRLLNDPETAKRLGEAARVRVRQEFLAPGLLRQQARLILSLLQSEP